MAEPLYEKELLADGRILYFRFYSTGAEAADTWFEEVQPVFDEAKAAQKSLLMLMENTSANPLSAEALQHARTISQMYPEAKGKTAFLVPAGVPAPTLKALVEHMLPKTRPTQIFTDKDEAIAWLLAP